jgi:hypothetical protein
MCPVRLACAGGALAALLAGCIALSGLDHLDEVSSETGADATPDAQPPGADGAETSGFCASQTHTFCADFDESSLSHGWTTTLVDDGGAITQDPRAFISAPYAFLSTMQYGFSGNEARLEEVFPQAASAIHVGFEMRLDDPSPDCHALKILTAGDSRLILSIESPQGLYEEDATDGSPELLYPLTEALLPAPEWNHVAIDLEIAATSTVSVSVNGDVVLSHALSAAFQGGSPIAFELGADEDGVTGCQLRFDNATVDLE